MQERMQLLRELQELDQELNALRQRRQKLDQENTALDADLSRVQDMVDSLSADLEVLRSQRQELTRSLAQEQENVEKAEGRLPTIKTQKEYVAVLKEIDTAKKLNKEILDRIQAKDDEIEVLNKDLEEKTAELTEIKSRVETRQSEISAQLTEFAQSQDDMERKRDSFLEQLPAPVRKRYHMLLDRRGGVAVVEARNGTCLGCNMHLPPQLFNSLFTSQEVQSCPHCNRLLYVMPLQ